jgi:hypothetical protein
MINHSVTSPTTGSTSLSPSSTATQVSEVNAIQYDSPQQPDGKKKIKNKLKKNNNPTENEKTQAQPPTTEKQPQQKPKFPCLICGDDNYTWDCPHRNEVAKCFK